MDLSGLEKAIFAIADDKQSGATALALKAIDIYNLYLEETMVSDERFLNNLKKLGDLLEKVQPSMTSISNVVEFVSQQISSNQNLPLTELRYCLQQSLKDLKADVVRAKSQIAHNALNYIPDGAVIITLSESSTVEEVIKQAYASKKVSRVIVAESRPHCEGLKFSQRLLKLGIPVTVIVDAALGFFCKDATLALVGADTVQSDGSIIHKIGTYTLALACYDLNSPFYVVCDSLKISNKATFDKPMPIKEKPPNEIINPLKLAGADVQNVYFDVTPAKYVTKIITEKGVFLPSKLSSTIF